MIGPASSARKLLDRLLGRTAVTLRETQGGYVIRSAKGREASTGLAARAESAFVTLASVLAAGLVLVPVAGMPLALRLPAAALIVGAANLAVVLRRRPGACECRVDLNRREICAAVVSGKGERWVQATARFGDVIEVVLRRDPAGGDLCSLCLRLQGRDDPVPVALGEEPVLMRIHDRIMGDLRPIEERLAGFGLNAAGESRPARGVFPELGPGQVRA